MILTLVGASAPGMANADERAWSAFARGEAVLLLRHAIAPGGGDPPGFRVDDCATQRNLDATGRRQAQRIGAALRARGIAGADVRSSRWCRCLETARLLDLGPVVPLDGLNSFFDLPEMREPNLAALRAFLAGTPATGPRVLVTHYVTVLAMTGRAVGSGEGVIARVTDGGELEWLADVVFNDG